LLIILFGLGTQRHDETNPSLFCFFQILSFLLSRVFLLQIGIYKIHYIMLVIVIAAMTRTTLCDDTYL
jgi:hypothetical protein